MFYGLKDIFKENKFISLLTCFWLLMEILKKRYHDSQTETVCQIYDPEKLEVQITRLYNHFLYTLPIGYKYIFFH